MRIAVQTQCILLILYLIIRKKVKNHRRKLFIFLFFFNAEKGKMPIFQCEDRIHDTRHT